MLKEQDRYWYRRAKERIVTCPTCDRCATVSEFITDGTIPISYWGFTYAKCPACGEISLFDYELMRLTKWGEGRKPPILMIGTGRYIDMLLAASSVYLLATQRLILLPVVFLIMLAVEIAWEIIIKRENPDW
ncbi:MAG: hypothetical protein Q7N50_13175, partial [Armatimonadota bacterium]|nr:hypothetical protein [Armatimonadota bacterium]